MIRDYWMQG